MTPTQRTAALLASLGIYAMRGRAGWYLYQCGVETATKLNFNFSRTAFQAIEATQLAEGRPLTTRQVKLLTGVK